MEFRVESHFQLPIHLYVPLEQYHALHPLTYALRDRHTEKDLGVHLVLRPFLVLDLFS